MEEIIEYPKERKKFKINDDIFPQVVDEGSISVSTCGKKHWDILFISSVVYAKEHNKKKIYFTFENYTLKYKVESNYIFMKNSKELKREMKKFPIGDFYEDVDNPLKLLLNLEENIPILLSFGDSKRVPRITVINHSCSCIERKVYVKSVNINFANSSLGDYLSNIIIYSSAHNFKGVIFPLPNSSRNKDKEETISNTKRYIRKQRKYLELPISEIIFESPSKNHFLKDPKELLKFLKKVKVNNICINVESVVENDLNPYYYLRYLIENDINVPVVYFSFNCNYVILKYFCTLCISLGIDMIRTIQ